MTGKEIGILTMHGMGREKPVDYEENVEYLKQQLFAHLDDEVKKDTRFQPISYQDQMQLQQEKVWQAMQQALGKFSLWHWLRVFMLYYFSDAGTYQYKPYLEDSVYLKVHRTIKVAIDKLHEQLGSQDQPIIIIAHSLGCFIISNHIWDVLEGKGIWRDETPSRFQRFDTLRFLFTTGCNIPLFVAGLEGVVPFDRPNEYFQWVNYYDKDDPLGWPLQPLNASYNQLVEDVGVNVGLTPLGHTKHWRKQAVIQPIAAKITALHASL